MRRRGSTATAAAICAVCGIWGPWVALGSSIEPEQFGARLWYDGRPSALTAVQGLVYAMGPAPNVSTHAVAHNDQLPLGPGAEPFAPPPGWAALAGPSDPASVAALAQARAQAQAQVQAQAQAQAQPGPFVSPVFRAPSGGLVLPTPDLLIAFRPDADPARVAQLLDALTERGAAPRALPGLAGAYRLRVARELAPDGYAALDLAEQLGADPAVRYAENDLFITGTGDLVPNDPAFVNLWGLRNNLYPGIDLGVTDAWDFTTGSPDVAGVVIDVGVDAGHPDLRTVPGFDATGANASGAPVEPCDNHGTAVAGVIGATMNNALGTVGVAPGCALVSARTFVAQPDCSGAWTSQTSWTIDALEYAQSIGARFTNNSNSYATPSAAIADKYAQTRAAGLLHFAAAGNVGGVTVSFPASLPSIISVGSVGIDGLRSSFSNYGSALDLVGPGEAVYTTDRSGAYGYSPGSYVYVNGTSFASPAVAGVAGLLFSADPTLTADEAEAFMLQSATDLGAPGFDPQHGYGIPSAAEAVYLALNRCDSGPDCDDGDPCNGTELCVNGQCAPGTITDCNNNGVDDACDIAAGTSEDCDGDGTPDECQLGLIAFSLTTPAQAPFDTNNPLVFQSADLPLALTDVRIRISARGDFGDFNEGLSLSVNGQYLGLGFISAPPCSQTDTTELFGIAAADWNNAVLSGALSIAVTASPGVTPGECAGSRVSLNVTYTALNPADVDGDGQLDACAACVADLTTRTKNPGEPGYGEPDGLIDGEDLSFYVELWLNHDPGADITTSNTNPGESGYGSPDGSVLGDDLSTFVDFWLNACQ